MSKKAQLKEIGKGLGLTIANNAKEETIAKKVAEKKGVTVEELYASLEPKETKPTENETGENTGTDNKAGAATGGNVQKPPTKPAATKPKSLKVIVHNNDPLSKDREFFIGHNGKPYRGLYEEEIDLDVNLIKILKNASVEVQEAILDDDGQPTGKTRTVEKKRFLIESVIDEL